MVDHLEDTAINILDNLVDNLEEVMEMSPVSVDLMGKTMELVGDLTAEVETISLVDLLMVEIISLVDLLMVETISLVDLLSINLEVKEVFRDLCLTQHNKICQ